MSDVVDKLVEARDMCAAKGAEIIAKRVNRVASGRFLFLFFIPRLARLRNLYRKAGEFLPKACCCECHK